MAETESAVAMRPVTSGGGLWNVVALTVTPADASGVGLALIAQTLKLYCVPLLRPVTWWEVPVESSEESAELFARGVARELERVSAAEEPGSNAADTDLAAPDRDILARFDAISARLDEISRSLGRPGRPIDASDPEWLERGIPAYRPIQLPPGTIAPSG